MIPKFGRLSTFFGKRYANVCNITVDPKVAICCRHLSRVGSVQQEHNYKTKCLLRNEGVHNFRTFSTGNRDAKIASVDYYDIKELPKHPEKLLIDVREPEELKETGTIPTSINIPLGSVLQVLAEDVRPQIFQAKYGRQKPTYDDEIIFTCKSGKRAHKAAEIARAMGFENLKYYAGSWEDWVQHENK